MRKAHPYELENKLSPKWTGPFRITEANGNGSYKLETLEGGAHPMQLECGQFKILFQLKNYDVHSCKGDTLFPSRGIFNEVTQVKKKFKKTLSQLFPLTQCKSKD